MMDTRNTNETHHRWAKGIRVGTIVVVLGTLAATWRPMHPETPPVVLTGEAAIAAGPDMSVYFPDRFPAPEGRDDVQPPTF